MIRYSRQIIMPEVGIEGQRRLKAARVLCVGAGGLGSPVALYLAAAGVGRIGLVDFDAVDLSNIQRQLLFGARDIGRPKLEAARERLEALNPNTEVIAHSLRLSSENVMGVLADYDVIVDGSDNFPTRYIVNDASVLSGKPDVYGSVFRLEGQVSVFDARRGPCYRCLFPEPPSPGLTPSCAEAGVLGVLPGIIGCLQALEVLKLILGNGEPLIGRLVLFDALALRFREIAVHKDPLCRLCGETPTIRAPVDEAALCGVRAGEAAVGRESVPGMHVETLRDLLAAGEPIELIDVREVCERIIARIEGSLPIPLGDLPGRLHELDSTRVCVVYCHTGLRSAQAVALMLRAGFRRVYSLTGGIDTWAARINPSLSRY